MARGCCLGSLLGIIATIALAAVVVLNGPGSAILAGHPRPTIDPVPVFVAPPSPRVEPTIGAPR